MSDRYDEMAEEFICDWGVDPSERTLAAEFRRIADEARSELRREIVARLSDVPDAEWPEGGFVSVRALAVEEQRYQKLAAEFAEWRSRSTNVWRDAQRAMQERVASLFAPLSNEARCIRALGVEDGPPPKVRP